MQITVSVDDVVHEQAAQYAGPDMTMDDLINEALRTYVRIQAGRRLATLGGTAPDMADIPRRRSWTDSKPEE